MNTKQDEDDKPKLNLLCKLGLHTYTQWGPLSIKTLYPGIDGEFNIYSKLRICPKCGWWQIKK